MTTTLRRFLVPMLLVGCTPGDGADDSDLPEPAPLAEVSGDCPDMTTEGLKTITSDGLERRFEVMLPEGDTTDAPLIFTFHGLTGVGFDVIGNFVSLSAAMELDQEAVVIVPESQTVDLVLGEVLLWGIEGGDVMQADLTLFDDLRTCASEQLGIDLRRVSAFGFSGGGLWTSTLLMERADVLASAVPASGGASTSSSLIATAGLDYRTPARKLPVMLVDGGPTDVWPDPTIPMLPFHDTTTALAQGLERDGHYIVRCIHDGGHTFPSDYWNPVRKWLLNHTYGAPSPFEAGEVSVAKKCNEGSE